MPLQEVTPFISRGEYIVLCVHIYTVTVNGLEYQNMSWNQNKEKLLTEIQDPECSRKERFYCMFNMKHTESLYQETLRE